MGLQAGRGPTKPQLEPLLLRGCAITGVIPGGKHPESVSPAPDNDLARVVDKPSIRVTFVRLETDCGQMWSTRQNRRRSPRLRIKSKWSGPRKRPSSDGRPLASSMAVAYRLILLQEQPSQVAGRDEDMTDPDLCLPPLASPAEAS